MKFSKGEVDLGFLNLTFEFMVALGIHILLYKLCFLLGIKEIRNWGPVIEARKFERSMCCLLDLRGNRLIEVKHRHIVLFEIKNC